MMKNKARFILPFLAVLCLMIVLFSITAFAGADDAKIGETTYATLIEALEASADGDTITLLQDVTWDETSPYTLSGKSITIDFGGYVLTPETGFMNIEADAGLTLEKAQINSNLAAAINWSDEVIQFGTAVFPYNAGSLTIASTADSGISCSSETYYSVFLFENTGDFTIEIGTFNMDFACAVCFSKAGSTISIEDAAVNLDANDTCFLDVVYGEVDIQTADVKGGTFIAELNGNAHVVFHDGTYDVDNQIVTDVFSSASVEFLDGSYTSGYSIVGFIYESASVTFEDGEYTACYIIYEFFDAGYKPNTASAEFIGGTYNADEYIVCLMYGAGSAVFNDGTYSSGNEFINLLCTKSEVEVHNGTYTITGSFIEEAMGESSVTIDDGTFTVGNDLITYMEDDLTVTINDGTYTCGDTIVDSTTSDTVLTINGGTFTAETGYGLDDISGTLIITGGSVAAYYDVIYLWGGNAEISGGTFTSTATTASDASSGMYIGNNGSALLSGGTFISNSEETAIFTREGSTVTLAEGYRYDPADWPDTQTSIVSVVPIYVNVTFLDADGTEIYKERIENGESVENWPETPQAPAENAFFEGWFDADGNCYESDAVFTKDTELTASWTLRYKVTYDVTPDSTYGMPEEYPVPEDDKYYLSGEKVTPVSFPESFAGEAKDSKTGKAVKGTWAFSGWDKEEFEITEDTTISGSWSFTPDEPEPTEPESTDPTEPGTPEEPTTPDNPQTGDRADMTGWLIALMAAAGIAAVCAARNKKQKKD